MQKQEQVKKEEARKTPEHLPTAADRLKRLNEISAALDADESGESTEDAEITEPAETAEENDGSV